MLRKILLSVSGWNLNMVLNGTVMKCSPPDIAAVDFIRALVTTFKRASISGLLVDIPSQMEMVRRRRR